MCVVMCVCGPVCVCVILGVRVGGSRGWWCRLWGGGAVGGRAFVLGGSAWTLGYFLIVIGKYLLWCGGAV